MQGDNCADEKRFQPRQGGEGCETEDKRKAEGKDMNTSLNGQQRRAVVKELWKEKKREILRFPTYGENGNVVRGVGGGSHGGVPGGVALEQ